jgi:small neutral amino acid transporter SnatA (MarC family)
MNSPLIAGIVGAVLVVWGCIVAVFNEWFTRVGKRTQRIYGQRAADMVTPHYSRFLGICLAVFGAALVVLALTGVIPGRPGI